MNRVYVVITRQAFILGVFTDEKMAAFAVRQHNVCNPDNPARMSYEPIIQSKG